MIDILVIAPLGVLFALVILEMSFSKSWNPMYFQKGIPLFKKTFSFQDGPAAGIMADILSKAFENREPLPIVFRNLNPDETAFQEKVPDSSSKSSYTPIMRGIIRINRVRGNVAVVGYANWSSFGFVVVIVTFSLFGLISRVDLAHFLVAVLLIYGYIYRIQFRLFCQVFERIRKEYDVSLN